MSLEGKVILITGANRGIGLHTTKALAEMGATIVMACRNLESAFTVAETIKNKTENHQIIVMELDLASLDSIRAFAARFHEQHPSLDILINNAGLFCMKREKTLNGFEKTMGVNYLGAFLLTHLLLPTLEATPGSRIIDLGSNAHFYGRIKLTEGFFQKGHTGFLAYASSKLAINLWTQELAHRLEGTGVTANVANPGHVATDIWNIFPQSPRLQFWINRLMLRFMLPPEEGAQTSIYLASSEEVADISGKYFFKDKQQPVSRRCRDVQLQRYLWHLSERLTGITRVMK